MLPDIAHKTTFLCKQANTWDWTPSTDASFYRLKQWICNTLLKTTLAYYDHTHPVQKQTVASKYGLGAALIQNNHPIAFASKTLTDILPFSSFRVRKISHLHIWMPHYSIQWSYALGNDPEEANPCSSHSYTKNATQTTKYDHNIMYRPGKEMVLADILSRFPPRRENLPINIATGATERDPILHTVYHITLNGWPDCIHEVPCIAHHFWGSRDELTVENGLLLEGDRVCIPLKLYQKMLHDLHDGLKGVEKM